MMIKRFLALACSLPTMRVADAQSCTSHASCADGEWCGAQHGSTSGNECWAPDSEDPSTYCTCGTAGAWYCPVGTEDPNSAVVVLGSTCCRPAPANWGAQAYATGCPSGNQWCGTDPANPAAGDHCQTITEDAPCVFARSAQPYQGEPVPCEDFPLGDDPAPTQTTPAENSAPTPTAPPAAKSASTVAGAAALIVVAVANLA
eukprot:SAG31_NODE_2653_length_5296_cov_2.690591_4_plen_202_part_00